MKSLSSFNSNGSIKLWAVFVERLHSEWEQMALKQQADGRGGRGAEQFLAFNSGHLSVTYLSNL